jgi:hypothetical protein
LLFKIPAQVPKKYFILMHKRCKTYDYVVPS